MDAQRVLQLVRAPHLLARFPSDGSVALPALDRADDEEEDDEDEGPVRARYAEAEPDAGDEWWPLPE